MLYELLGTLFLIVLLYIIRTWYIVPRKIMKGYADILRNKGYRVRFFPYSLLNTPYYYLVNKSSKGEDLGDPFKNLREEYPNYDVIISNVLNQPFLELCSPELTKQFYAVDKHYSYSKQPSSMQTFGRIIGSGLVSSEGQQWKRKRKIFNKVFNFEFLKSQTYNLAQISERFFRQAEEDKVKIDQKSGQKYIEVNLLNVLLQIFSEVMLQTFLGLNTDNKIQGEHIGAFLKRLMDDATQSGYSLLNFFLGKKFIKLGLKKLDRDINRRALLYKNKMIPFIRGKIQKFKQKLKDDSLNTKPVDIIQLLVMEKQKNKQDSITNQQEIFNQFTTFFFAGTQTTSNFVQIMIYTIASLPSVEASLRQQISKFMQNDDYSYENLKNFIYIDNIQKEITRLYGPGTFLFWRIANQDNHLGNLPVKKGTLLSIVSHGSHYSDKYFKKPNEFRPQRWDQQCKELSPFVFGGFSFGARSCIGKHLAMVESKIALIKFMKRYKKIILPKKDWKFQAKFVFCPENMMVKLVIDE